MVPDELGFRRPVVDASACVGCGRCEQACPALSPCEQDVAVETWWAAAADEALLARSSSGGVFGLLAREILAGGGCVYGAAFAEGCTSVRHVRVDALDGLDAVMRSKYVQSAVGPEVYQGVAADLRAGRKVLFSGTACQVAAMRNFLELRHVPQDKLLLVDVICHGVPSPELWRRWLGSVAADSAQPEIDFVNFRSKTSGWTSYSVAYCVATEKDKVPAGRETVFKDDWYMKAFLQNASLRGSCLECPAKRRCGSDLTLGDFWGVQRCHPEAFDDRGTSAVIANTEAGVAALDVLGDALRCGSCTYDEIVTGNPALVRSVQPYAKREEFLADVASGMPVAELQARWTFEPTAGERLRRRLRRAMGKLARLVLGEDGAQVLKAKLKALLRR